MYIARTKLFLYCNEKVQKVTLQNFQLIMFSLTISFLKINFTDNSIWGSS